MKSVIIFMTCLLSAFLGVKVARRVVSQIKPPSMEKPMASVAETELQEPSDGIAQKSDLTKAETIVHQDLPMDTNRIVQDTEVTRDLDASSTTNEKIDYLSEIDSQNERMMDSL